MPLVSSRTPRIEGRSFISRLIVAPGMGLGEVLSGEELSIRRVGVIIVGWLALVCVISVLLLLYTAFIV